MSERAEPVGGKILTTPMKFLLGLAGLGAVLTIWRFAVGLGPSTGMSDAYPWGIWIAWDVVTGTALGCGGYAMAMLVYIFNKGKYHPLVRPAILTSALGYTMAAVSIVIDVGRPWFICRIPTGGFPDMGSYNWNSALLEVALCVMAYMIVLWIELSPAFFEKWKDEPGHKLQKISGTLHGFLEKALIWIIALGILLPTMHQSSLGSLMLLSGPRLHTIWNSPLLPLLFLISCVNMGFAVVVMESALASRAFKRKPETAMLASLAGAVAFTAWLFLVIRLGDVIFRQQLGVIFKPDVYALMFWLETLVLVAPAVMLLNKGRRNDLGFLFRAALLLIVAGILYRFNSYLVAFMPGEGHSYFPTLPEMFITFGIISAEILIYVAVVKRFPILAGKPATATAQ